MNGKNSKQFGHMAVFIGIRNPETVYDHLYPKPKNVLIVDKLGNVSNQDLGWPILWMDEIHFAPPKKPWCMMIPL